MSEYDRRENETFNAWVTRLCIGKKDGSIVLSWNEINEILGHPMSTDHLRKLANGIRMTEIVEDTRDPDERVVVEKNRDGTITDERIISLEPGELADDRKVMTAHGYDPELWEVVSSRHSIWQAHTKKGPTKTLYASKITVKPRTSNFDASEIIKGAMALYTVPTFEYTNYDRNGRLFEMSLPDIHINELSWKGETGEDYDAKIARERVEAVTKDIISRIGETKFEEIVIGQDGDFHHIDNIIGTTTKGTQQDTDTRYPKMMKLAFAIVVMVIEQLATLAPVKFINIIGNHDGQASFDMAFALEQRYRNTPGITIDARPIARKWIEYGVNLIGFMHGDMPKKYSSTWLSVEAREAYGRTKYHEIHAGHYHDEIKPFPDGVTVRYLPTLKSIDKWHYDQGYIWARKTICSFIWDKETGLREIWYSNIQEAVI